MESFRLLSIPFNVRTTAPGLMDSLRWHLEPFRVQALQADAVNVRIYVLEEDTDTQRYSYIRGGNIIRSNTILAPLLLDVVWDMTSYAPLHAGDFLSLHAGAVAGGEGAALFPAENDTGKSTTVAALLDKGFGYLSDEAAPIDPITTRVFPYPRRLALDDGALARFPGLSQRLGDRVGLTADLEFRERFVRPEDLGGTVGAPAPVRWLVFLARDHDGGPRLSPISRAEAVERLAGNAFNLHRYRERGVILLSRLAAGAEAVQLEGGTPQERADLLGERFSG